MSSFSDEMYAAIRAGESPRNLLTKLVDKLVALESDTADARLDLLETFQAAATAELADHESRLDALEA